MAQFYQALYAFFFQNPYELAGFITSLLCVWLNARQNAWGWFFAIVAAACYIQVYAQIRLIGDLLLQVVFILVSMYGWYHWQFGKRAHQVRLPVSLIPLREAGLLLLLVVVGTWLTAQLLAWLDGDLVYLDAATTVISLAAQWMMARKYLENWWVWIGVDVVYLGIYCYKAVYLTALLYFIFLFLAYWGGQQWRKALKAQSEHSGAIG
ncbi:MAG: nicotinamide mononucleotide transporter [Microscillaceae bacterium]|nr:nicotinamide mononucleotide transporter [Microscillaceae bacterium]